MALIIAGLAVYYTGEHFAINTDITKLIANDIPWRQREIDFDKLFPNRNGGYILAVVDAPTPELATLARAELADKLSADKSLFKSVSQLGGSPFFAQNGLLFLPTRRTCRHHQVARPGRAAGACAGDRSQPARCQRDGRLRVSPASTAVN